MADNVSMLRKNLADKYYLRNKINFKKSKKNSEQLLNCLKTTGIKPKSILEIGCLNGHKLNNIKNFYKNKKLKLFGLDLSKKAITDAKKKFKGIKFYNNSSLDLDILNLKVDLIICDFLYLLDRRYIFQQFDMIYKSLSSGGFLVICDFDPSFTHFNLDKRDKKLKSYKMSYYQILCGSNLFKLKYMNKWKVKNNYFISNDISISLYQKINYLEEFPSNV